MAASYKTPNATLVKILTGQFDPTNDTMKAMLLTSSHTTDVDTQEFADDISANEVSTSGSYTSGFGNRIALTFSTNQDDANDEGELDLTDFTATTFTGSVLYVAYIKEITNDADSPIYGIEELSSTISSTAGTWSYTTAAGGLLVLKNA